MDKLLEIKDLKVEIKDKGEVIYPVSNVSFSLNHGDIMGLVGESGCGKTMTALSIIRLLPKKIAKIIEGEIILDGENLAEYSRSRMIGVRGKKIGMIFQDPLTSLNPTLSIKEQICETLITHKKVSKLEAKVEAVKILRMLEIPSPEKVINYFPYQLSGGMRQRIVIAIAISCDPVLLIADEPTTALDVTIQKQILVLLKKLQKKLDKTMILISHDLNVIGELCNRVSIMYAGKIVEESSIGDIFKNPMHPYTNSLFRCIPNISDISIGRLPNIKGAPPDFTDLPGGCRFHPRCEYAKERCKLEEPLLLGKNGKNKVACFYPLNFISK